MKDFFKNNLKAIITLILCVLVLGALIMFTGKEILNPFDLSRIGTPIVDVDNSIKEIEIQSQGDLSLSSTLSNSKLNDDAMSYGDFLEVYGDKRIQFDEGCRATPNNASFTVGDFLILDNRSDKVQAVKFIDDLYALPPFHVRVFELKRQGIFDIDCGSSKNVAKITVH